MAEYDNTIEELQSQLLEQQVSLNQERPFVTAGCHECRGVIFF